MDGKRSGALQGEMLALPRPAYPKRPTFRAPPGRAQGGG